MNSTEELDIGQLVTFREAGRFLPEDFRPCYQTWWRWWRKGVKGTKLKTALLGGRRFTTRAAIEEFVSRLTAAMDDEG
jgi:hypothetical protein